MVADAGNPYRGMNLVNDSIVSSSDERFSRNFRSENSEPVLVIGRQLIESRGDTGIQGYLLAEFPNSDSGFVDLINQVITCRFYVRR